ncbi:MAG: ABC transporter permease subunit, partial [Candidatus Eremiobacteraeota bacterium]|nr:ABC transporter permease subunit [Candidatus Eremiobacteraeota bacterium]
MVLNPVLGQELRLRMRDGQAYVLLTAVILVFGGVCLATFWSLTNLLRPVAPFPVQVVSQQASIPTQGAAPQLDRLLISQRSVVFFLIMALWAILLTALIVPGASSGTLAREKETNSLPLLLGTPLSAFSVVAGKMLASASYILLVIAASIPLFSMVVMFGGVALQEVAAVIVIVLATAFAFTAFGVFVSSL